MAGRERRPAPGPGVGGRSGQAPRRPQAPVRLHSGRAHSAGGLGAGGAGPRPLLRHHGGEQRASERGLYPHRAEAGSARPPPGLPAPRIRAGPGEGLLHLPWSLERPDIQLFKRSQSGWEFIDRTTLEPFTADDVPERDELLINFRRFFDHAQPRDDYHNFWSSA